MKTGDERLTKIKYDLDLGKAHGDYMKANGMLQLMDALEKIHATPAETTRVQPLTIRGAILRTLSTISRTLPYPR